GVPAWVTTAQKRLACCRRPSVNTAVAKRHPCRGGMFPCDLRSLAYVDISRSPWNLPSNMLPQRAVRTRVGAWLATGAMVFLCLASFSHAADQQTSPPNTPYRD